MAARTNRRLDKAEPRLKKSRAERIFMKAISRCRASGLLRQTAVMIESVVRTSR
jgi:hypothetical protein